MSQYGPLEFKHLIKVLYHSAVCTTGIAYCYKCYQKVKGYTSATFLHLEPCSQVRHDAPIWQNQLSTLTRIIGYRCRRWTFLSWALVLGLRISYLVYLIILNVGDAENTDPSQLQYFDGHLLFQLIVDCAENKPCHRGNGAIVVEGKRCTHFEIEL